MNSAENNMYYFFENEQQANTCQNDWSIRRSLGDDFFIKSIRADNCDFFRKQTINLLTRTAKQQIKYPLRPLLKRRYTVTGDGIFERSKKTPQYTKEEKLLFSQPQSFSLVTKDVQAPVFGFGRSRNKKLVAVGLHKNDVLPTRRLLVCDSATVIRPYDFHTLSDAVLYCYENINSNLFSDFEKFKKAIGKLRNRGNYNEVLVRARWNIASSHILIASNTLEARLIAQDRARILKNRLKVQSTEMYTGFSDNYEVPIGFYLPGKSLHLRPYTIKEQNIDKMRALNIYANKKECARKYKSGDYEFLLGLDDSTPVFSEKLQSNDYSLILKILDDGYVHIVKSLLEKASSQDLENVTLNGNMKKALSQAIKYGDDELVKWLISKCASVTQLFIDTLHDRNIDAIKYLIEHYINDIDINSPAIASDNNPLLLMCIEGNVKLVKLLLTKTIDVNKTNKSGETALYYACQMGHKKIARQLLLHGANPDIQNTNGRTAIITAAMMDHGIICQLLISHNANTLLIDNNHFTAVDYMSNSDRRYTYNLLVDSVAIDLKSEAYDMNTKLLFACQSGLFTNVRELVTQGANLNCSTATGITPLMLAVSKGDINIVKFLLENGADINMTGTNNGNTALHIATSFKNIDIVHLLIEHQADQTILNNLKQTPLIIAKKINAKEIEVFLKQTLPKKDYVRKRIFNFFETTNKSNSSTSIQSPRKASI